MVQQTRKVVEDYILFKIHKALSTGNYRSNHGLPPLPTPTQLNISVRNMSEQYELKYSETFPDLLAEIREANISPTDVDKIFSSITKDLFQLPLKQIIPSSSASNGNIAATSDNHYASVHTVAFDDAHIKWGHVIGLLVFAGLMAVRAVECHSSETVDTIINWVTKFLESELSHWLTKQGGWEGFTEWSKASEQRDYSKGSNFDPNTFSSGIRSFMGVGVMAACVGLGALMLGKK